MCGPAARATSELRGEGQPAVTASAVRGSDRFLEKTRRSSLGQPVPVPWPHKTRRLGILHDSQEQQTKAMACAQQEASDTHTPPTLRPGVNPEPPPLQGAGSPLVCEGLRGRRARQQLTLDEKGHLRDQWSAPPRQITVLSPERG